MKSTLIVVVFLICALSVPVVEVKAANIIDIYDSYAIESNVEVGRTSETVWIARWQHNGIIITEGLDATVTGNIPLEYSAKYGGWVGYDMKFEATLVNYSIESASTTISWGFIQTAPIVQILYYGELVVENTTTSIETTEEIIYIPPIYPEVVNSAGLGFALFLGAIITILWKVNKDMGEQ